MVTFVLNVLCKRKTEYIENLLSSSSFSFFSSLEYRIGNSQHTHSQSLNTIIYLNFHLIQLKNKIPIPSPSANIFQIPQLTHQLFIPTIANSSHETQSHLLVLYIHPKAVYEFPKEPFEICPGFGFESSTLHKEIRGANGDLRVYSTDLLLLGITSKG